METTKTKEPNEPNPHSGPDLKLFDTQPILTILLFTL